MEWHCAGCSTGPLPGTVCPNTSVRAMTLYRFKQWQANLPVLEVKEIKTVPYVPISHPFVERLIGTIRREYLDRILFWTTADLEQKLLDFQHYYNGYRTHAGLQGRVRESTDDRSAFPLSLDSYRWKAHIPIAA
jgi:putative transposase